MSVVVPAYNEARTITETVTDVCAYFERKACPFEVIVSADGTDGTRELAGQLAAHDPRIRVIGSPVRLGKGRGVREGMKLANGEIVGFVDADNKTPIDDFDHVERAFRDGADVVIGSRAVPGARVERPQPLHRRLGSRGFAVALHAIVGLRAIPDTQCGFKFFREDAARHLFGRQQVDGYMFDVEILYLAVQARYRIAQVPVRWCDDADSRLDLLGGNVRNGIDLLRIRFGR